MEQYKEMKQKYPNYLTFRVADLDSVAAKDIKRKVCQLRNTMPPRRLAWQIVACLHNRAVSTVESDWKKHKQAKIIRYDHGRSARKT